MNKQQNEIHLRQVELWRKKNEGLPPRELTLLYLKAIRMVYERSLQTLSRITVGAVIDRTLFECQERFPILAEVSTEEGVPQFAQFIGRTENSEPAVIQRALEDYLVELLSVFGKITADILTKYLHQELMKVTSNASDTETDNASDARRNPSKTASTNSFELIKKREKK